MKKRHDIALILIIILGIATISFSIYEYTNKKEVQESVIEEVSEPQPFIEEPKRVGSNEVLIQIFRTEFDKKEITIQVGTKVIWQNMDTRRHMITNKRLGLFRTMRKSLEQGDTFEYTFDKPGSYEILEANFGINGLIIVEEKPPNMITGYVVSSLEVNGLTFLLLSINLFVLTTLALTVGFHVSRKQQR